MTYFESHAHYDDGRFENDRHELLTNLPDDGVAFIINSGATYESSLASVALSKQYNHVYAAVGVHPHDAVTLNNDMLRKLMALCSQEKVVAFGEIGLDFYYDNSPRTVQQEWFMKQLDAAKEVGLPIIIHSRDAAQLTFDMLKDADMPDYGGKGAGVIHCYTGSKEMALDYIRMGYYIGVGGVVTFPNAKKLVETVAAIPVDKILIETDCPYLSPSPNRGKRNDSSNLKFVVEKIADIKNISPEEVAEITMSNAKLLFSVK